MAKERQEIAGIIPENEWKSELEKDVEYFYSLAEKPDIIYDKRYTPNEYPDYFKDSREELEYQMQEIDRVCAAYPELTDDAFVRQNIARWLA